MPVKNEVGNRYGRLTVLERAENNYRGDAFWLCQCDCGEKVNIKGISLRSGHTKSCGCLQKEIVKAQGHKNTYDLIGKQFGKLTVIERIPGSEEVKGKWKCQCECGGTTITTSDHLVSGHSQSCGCLQSQKVHLIGKLLTDNNLNFIKEYTFEDLKSSKNYVLRFDFGVVDNFGKLLFLIEYDGVQHFDQTNFFWTEDIVINDKLKDEYCINNKIKLYRINHTEEVVEKLLDIIKVEFKDK